MNLYIHIPFCQSKCSYCHFYSSLQTSSIDDFLESLLYEINIRQANKPKVDTIYFGGGTPSLLPPKKLEKILKAFKYDNKAEITLETHPQTLSTKKIDDYISLGINRLSIGIQSWNQDILHHMGRTFDQPQSIKLIHYAQDRGLTNINLDHIISYPNQTNAILEQDISTSLSLNPTHVSLYPLERHPHTRINRSPRKDKIIHQYTIAQTKLIAAGFKHYEELNFCQPGYECRHNLNFWQGQDYIGLGPSATSRLKDTIRTNHANIAQYINSSKQKQDIPHTEEELTTTQQKELDKELKQRLL